MNYPMPLPVLMAAAVATLGLGLTSSEALSQDEMIAKSPEQIEWFPTPVGAAAPLWGDMQRSAYGRLSKWNPGTASPMHMHSHAYHSVILSGTFENVIADTQQVQTHAAGAYYYMPANVRHLTRCVSEEPCVMYLHQKGPWDVKVAP